MVMVICRPNHYGIDTVVPCQCVSKTMCPARNDMLAISIEFKNDNYFCKKTFRNMFRRKSPFDSGLFDNKNVSLLIIRTVIAPSSTITPGITFLPAQNSPNNVVNIPRTTLGLREYHRTFECIGGRMISPHTSISNF